MRSLPKTKLIETAGYVFENFLSQDAIYPFYASLKVTHKCNFHCKFCDVWRENIPDMSTEEVCTIIDNLANSSIIVVSFEGGDPLLREDILPLLRYTRTKPFYLLFTTSERNLTEYPMEDYCKYIDFLHVSIDEGHRNLEMFDQLEEFMSWGPIVCVQTVVTNDDIDSLEKKVQRCWEVGAKIVVMAAVHLDGTLNHFPDTPKLRATSLRLKKKYPNTIISPDRYFDNMMIDHGCTSSSIIIDSDGYLFYPCRILKRKAVNLMSTPLMGFLRSEEARKCREIMRACKRKCGWYQYFATSSFTSPLDFFSALKPYYANLLTRNSLKGDYNL